MNNRAKSILFAGTTVGLAVYVLAFSKLAAGAWSGGTDEQAVNAISKIDPSYKPWFKPLWEPPSGEVESLIFGLQAAAGAGVLCYALGYWRGRRERNDRA